MKKYKHYILTRFNLGVYDIDNAYADIVGDAEKWMQHRIDLFESTAFPSMMSQVNKNFTWLIAFDERTPKKVIQKYDYCNNIEVCYIQPHLYLRTLDPSHEWLITTRFDNDDIFNPTFIDIIQAEFNEQVEVIDIEYSKVNFGKKEQFPSNRPRANSPFLSLVERWGKDPMTALGHPHSVMPDIYESRKLDLILAQQVIHDRNVINKI